jgi:protein-arginine kinase activator protein McsA
MRCLSCNKNLTDFESTRKFASTGEFLDLCNRCYSDIQDDVDTIVRPELQENEEVDEDDFDEDRIDTIGQNGNNGDHYE